MDGSVSGNHHGAATVIQSLGPSLFRIRSALQKFAGGTVQQVIEGIPVRHRHGLALPPAHRRIEQHRNFGRVPIVGVMRSELEMPLQLARIGVKCHQRAGIEIVARPYVTVPIGSGVPHAPVDQVGFRIVGAGDPCGASPGLPVVALPCIVSGLTGRRDRPKTPQPFTAIRVIGLNETANAGFAARNPGNNSCRRWRAARP